ncbi:MAG: PD-(D/E)XK nuclease family protein [Alphaproteobacteria bacterium]|nr:PD-(D/E)XK nuclease family protein [Alphaproteobacteria bacterium]
MAGTNGSGRARGVLVHALLARLAGVSPSDRDAAARDFLAAKMKDATEAAQIASETLQVLADPRFASAFGPDSRAEVDLAADLPEVGVKVSGRIDRLLIGDEILAIDFKTDARIPERPSSIPLTYVSQMALYRAALSKIFPGRPVTCALLWTRGPRLMPIPSEILDVRITALGRLDHSGTRS